MACVDIEALPLQLLLRRNPQWRGHAVAVVDRNSPQGKILWVNESARKARILPGMTVIAALSLSGDLRADEVARHDIESAVDALSERLEQFTPGVEPSADEPGVFWLDASGLARVLPSVLPRGSPEGSRKGLREGAGFLYESLLRWARLIRCDLERHELLECAIVVGFTRFGTYVNVRAGRGIVVFRENSDEDARAHRVPLDRLGRLLTPAVRETLDRLGIRTVGAFTGLPSEGIRKRFGKDAWRLHRLARGTLQEPIEPRSPRTPLRESVHLDHAEADATRLIAIMERLLRELLKGLASRDEALAGLNIVLRFEGGGEHREEICPAAPTLDGKQLVELITLRLASTSLPDGVSGIIVSAVGRRLTRTQLDLLFERPPRDLAAANRALARIRAEFGEDAVVCAALREGHLPEALFFWQPLEKMYEARPVEREPGTLVRRIYTPPVPLPARPRHEPDGWMLRGLDQGPVVRVLGPYIVSGGWWRRTGAVHREYHFAETQKGELLWTYYDRSRRRWFLQGRVE